MTRKPFDFKHQTCRSFLILRASIVWYNSPVKMILAFLLLFCAPFTGLAVEAFVLGPSLEPDAESVTNVPVVVNKRFDIMIR